MKKALLVAAALAACSSPPAPQQPTPLAQPAPDPDTLPVQTPAATAPNA